MDTRDDFSSFTSTADTAINPDAIEANPGLEEAAEVAGEAVAEEVRGWNWKLIGAVAGGVALAAGVGAALYLKAQHDRELPVKRLGLDRLGVKRKDIDKAGASARRLAQQARQRVRALPVRQVTKTVVNKVSALMPN
ncbi:hypothetical protein [Asticcacaulis solisilvae]|uniref:hypothetical protein n=1 Tax=Asticcacaulis solisilvae TaxID=1217274 RepID=UPI003FD78E8C